MKEYNSEQTLKILNDSLAENFESIFLFERFYKDSKLSKEEVQEIALELYNLNRKANIVLGKLKP